MAYLYAIDKMQNADKTLTFTNQLSEQTLRRPSLYTNNGTHYTRTFYLWPSTGGTRRSKHVGWPTLCTGLPPPPPHALVSHMRLKKQKMIINNNNNSRGFATRQRGIINKGWQQFGRLVVRATGWLTSFYRLIVESSHPLFLSIYIPSSFLSVIFILHCIHFTYYSSNCKSLVPMIRSKIALVM